MNKLFHMFTVVLAIVLNLFLINPVLAAASFNITIISESDQAQNNIPLTFGQPFRKGDVPVGMDLSENPNLNAKLSDGTEIPLQVDSKATYDDGTLRHAVLTLQLASLTANEVKSITLSTENNATVNATALTLDQLLATNFDAVINLNIGGTMYTASARDLLESSTENKWLSGPLVTEWMVSAPFKNDAGQAHPHLTARFNIRAYAGMSRVRADVTVENNWTYEPGPRNFTYDASVLVGGKQVFSKTALTHYHHARWRKTFWWGDKPAAHIKHDLNYLLLTQSIPNYDSSIVIAESALIEEQQALLSSQTDPMDIAFMNAYMPTTGGRSDIGPLPRWTARYLISMDKRAWEATQKIGELAGSWPMHYRDKNTDFPVSLQDHPNATVTQGAGGDNAFCSTDCTVPYTVDTAHQPSLAYIPYLVTGDYYFLEELQFWANYNMLAINSSNRQGSKGLLYSDQVRGEAWAMRTLGQAAYITPDNHPLKQYFIDRVNDNLDYYNNTYALNPAQEQYVLGRLDHGGFSDGGATSKPWMDDFFTWSIGHLVDLGFTKAEILREYKVKFSVGRMTDPGYCWLNAAQYQTTQPGTTFAELYANNAADQGWVSLDQCTGNNMAGYPDSPQGYVAILQAALAVAVDSGNANAQYAWNRFESRSTKVDYGSAGPEFAIVPSNPNAAGISFTSDRAQIAIGGTVVLTWDVENANTCTASGDWSGSKSVSGSEIVGPLVTDATFILNCTGAEGGASGSVTVLVGDNGPRLPINNTTPQNYTWDVLTAGTSVYVDRNYTYTTIPAVYETLDVLQTGNNDKSATGNSFITFNIAEPVTVYVAYADSGTNLPAWLSGWTVTGDQLGTTDRTLHLYSKDFAAGTVSLGGNETAPSMYTVLVAAISTTGGSGSGGSDGSSGSGGSTGSNDSSVSSVTSVSGGGGSMGLIELMVGLMGLIISFAYRSKKSQVLEAKKA